MTNYEKYKDEIKEAIRLEVLGDWCDKHGIYKTTDTGLYSAMKIAMWLMEEYNPATDHHEARNEMLNLMKQMKECCNKFGECNEETETGCPFYYWCNIEDWGNIG